MPTTLTLDEVESLSYRMLTASGATPLQAGPTARSIRDGEADGIRNVALGYLPTYCDHLAVGKVVRNAVPTMETPRPGVVHVDAKLGFAHPAFLFGLEPLIQATTACGIGVLTVSHSYSAGILGWFVERVASAGHISMMFANSSPAMAPYGGAVPFFGTNPLAWAVPRQSGPPLVADLSSSHTAWVNVKAAAEKNESIPLGWALDAEGQPTTDPAVGLAGSMAPSGGHKGSAFALLVDLLAGGVTASNFSHEASSFGGTDGGPPNVGQVVIAIDPSVSSPAFLDRVEHELTAMSSQPGVRLPGDRRIAFRSAAEAHGVEVPDDLMATLNEYAANGSPARA